MTVTDLSGPRARSRRPVRAELDALAAIESLADKIRYACEHAPPPITTEGVRAWLGAREVPTTREYTSRVVNAWKRSAGLPATPPKGLPVITTPAPDPEPVTELTASTDPSTDTPPATGEATPAPSVPAELPVTVTDLPEPLVTVTVEPSPAPEPARSSAPSPLGAAWSRWLANVVLVVPLLLVNSVAVYGQSQWAHEHLNPSWVIAVGFAATIESIGIFLAAEAHRSLMAGDAAARLRLGSYGVGVLAGCLNFAHFSPGGISHPTTAGLTFGALSALSPWLWAVRSRSLSRAELRSKGLIDSRSVKFPAVQWALFPVRSARQFRAAVWVGETNPAAARRLDPKEVLPGK